MPELGGNGRLQRVRYPRKGEGFPRRYIDHTPAEILYDPRRILGGRTDAITTIPTGETTLLQPRVESSRSVEIERSCIPERVPHFCPAPPSQVPYTKRQIHLDPSRDAEILYHRGVADVPAGSPASPSSATVLSFETFNNLRYVIRWIGNYVFDALVPSALVSEIRVEGVAKKIFAVTTTTTSPFPYGPPTSTTVATPTAVDMQCVPAYFHNMLLEITDRRKVDVVVTNTAPADRRVIVCLWGWIESITIWDESVKR